MPTSEAQKRASKKWRANHKDKFNDAIYTWRESNPSKQLEYARKCMAKNYLWKCAIRDLMRCLL